MLFITASVGGSGDASAAGDPQDVPRDVDQRPIICWARRWAQSHLVVAASDFRPSIAVIPKASSLIAKLRRKPNARSRQEKDKSENGTRKSPTGKVINFSYYSVSVLISRI